MAYLALLFLRAGVWNGSGSDEVFYYAQATSPVWDGDIELSNDILQSRNDIDRRFVMAEGLYLTGRQQFAFACGTPLLNIPAVAGFRVADAMTGNRMSGANRYAYVHRAAITMMAWIVGLAGLLACFRVAARFTDAWRAFWIAIVLFLGTNLPFYVWRDPAMSHVHSFAAMAMVVWAALRYTENPTAARAFLGGILCGVAFLVRWQDGVSILLMIATWVSVAARTPSECRVWNIKHLAIILAAWVVAMAPQFLIWRRIHGAGFTVPQGEAYLVWEARRLWDVLFSPLNGWIVSHPVVALFLLAIPFAVWRLRWIGTGIALVVGVEIVVNSLPRDWWGSGTFGGRRFMGALPLLVPGAALAVEWMRRRNRRWLVVAVAGCAGVAVVLNALVLIRSAYSGPLPAWWWMGRAGWATTVALPVSHLDHVFSSDLFVPPVRSDLAIEVYGVFLAIWLMTVGAGFGLLAAIERGRRGAGRRFAGEWVIPAVALGGVVTLGAVWSLLPQPNAEASGNWGLRVMELRREGRESEIPEEADRWIAAASRERPAAAVTQLRAIVFMLSKQRYGDADAVTRELERRIPATAPELWIDAPSSARPEWRRWITRALMARAPSDRFVSRLYSKLCRQGELEWARALSQRLGGPAWERERRRGVWAWQNGDKLHRVARHFQKAWEWNPADAGAVTAMLPLKESGDEDGGAMCLGALEATEPAMRLARRVVETKPELIAPLQSNWMHAILQRASCFEWNGNLDAMSENLVFVRRATIAPEFMEGLQSHHDEVFLRRLRLQGATHIPLSDVDIVAPEPEFPENANATCSPRWLERGDGWGDLEEHADGTGAWRWSVERNVWIRFEKPLPAGRYVLHIKGLRHGAWDSKATMQIQVRGESKRFYGEVPTGQWNLSIPFTLEHDHAAPVMRVFFPTAPISSYDPESGDPRWVGFLCEAAWVSPI